jgi:hypothetical protein
LESSKKVLRKNPNYMEIFDWYFERLTVSFNHFVEPLDWRGVAGRFQVVLFLQSVNIVDDCKTILQHQKGGTSIKLLVSKHSSCSLEFS